MLASELFAISNGNKCEGEEQCYWCSASCKRLWLHDDPPPPPYVKRKHLAKRPNSAYVCIGCWLYRRKRVTVFFLGGGLKDRQEACNHSLFVTESEVKALDLKKPEVIYQVLLSPPTTFSLSILENEKQNMLQFQVANTHEVIKAETKLHFTLDNVLFSYSVYELEEGLKHGGEGKEPGVQALLRLLGPYKTEEMENGKERKRGRPTIEEKVTPDKVLRKIVSK